MNIYINMYICVYLRVGGLEKKLTFLSNLSYIQSIKNIVSFKSV